MTELHDADGTIVYGGHTFRGSVETSAEVKPEYSRDGRTVSYSVVTITFTSYISSTSQGLLKQELAIALAALQKPAQRFRYVGRGFDRLFTALGVGNAKDLAWGPMPRVLKVRPLGGVPANSYQLVWQMEARVPTCLNARFTGPIDLATTCEHQVDEAGFTTRIWEATLKIANFRRGGPTGRTGVYSPDDYRDDVLPAIPPGFTREYFPARISEDRTELSFGCIDREMLDIPRPEIIAYPDLRDEVTSGELGGTSYVRRFSGEYELAKDAKDVYSAARHFFEDFVGSRLDAMEVRGGKMPFPSAIVPIAFSFGQPQAGRRRKATFSATFTFTCDMEHVLGNVGMWKPVPGTSWSMWKQSLAGSTFNAYGMAKMRLKPADDRIVDPCDLGEASIATLTGGTVPTSISAVIQAVIEEMLRNIRPDNSWIEYNNRLEIIPDTGAVLVATLPRALEELKADTSLGLGALGGVIGLAFNAGNRLSRMPGVVGGAAAAGAAGSASKKRMPPGIQRRTTDRFKIRMIGSAMRAKYQIPPPELVEVGGVEVHPLFDKDRDYWTQTPVFNAGVQVWGAAWHFTYYAEENFKKPVEPAPNPLLQPQR